MVAGPFEVRRSGADPCVHPSTHQRESPEIRRSGADSVPTPARVVKNPPKSAVRAPPGGIPSTRGHESGRHQIASSPRASTVKSPNVRSAGLPDREPGTPLVFRSTPSALSDQEALLVRRRAATARRAAMPPAPPARITNQSSPSPPVRGNLGTGRFLLSIGVL